MKKLVLVIFFFVYFILFGPKTVFAQIIFTEVYPQPRSGESEWLELANLTDQTVNLFGWTIEDLLSAPKVIHTFPDFDLLPNYLLVASVSSQLNNSGDGVVLKDNLGQVITAMNYDSSALGMSWSLADEGVYAISTPSAGWHHDLLVTIDVLEPSATISAQPSPTPEPTILAHPLPTPLSSPSPQLPQPTNELMPQLMRISSCPKVGPEWLEWFNPYDMNIQTSLLIKDLQNNSLRLELQLPPTQKVTSPLSRNIFNNSGDEIFVYFQDNLLVSQKIPACTQEGMVFSLVDQGTSTTQGAQGAEVVNLTSDKIDLNLEDINQKNEFANKFTFPQSVLIGTMKSGARQSPSQILQPSQSSGLALGVQSVDQASQQSDFFPAWLLILGGFLWLGLGIIKTYGQQIFGHQAVDKGFFASNSLG